MINSHETYNAKREYLSIIAQDPSLKKLKPNYDFTTKKKIYYNIKKLRIHEQYNLQKEIIGLIKFKSSALLPKYNPKSQVNVGFNGDKPLIVKWSDK